MKGIKKQINILPENEFPEQVELQIKKTQVICQQ
jgi:hypothetical protein